MHFGESCDVGKIRTFQRLICSRNKMWTICFLQWFVCSLVGVCEQYFVGPEINVMQTAGWLIYVSHSSGNIIARSLRMCIHVPKVNISCLCLYRIFCTCYKHCQRQTKYPEIVVTKYFNITKHKTGQDTIIDWTLLFQDSHKWKHLTPEQSLIRTMLEGTVLNGEQNSLNCLKWGYFQTQTIQYETVTDQDSFRPEHFQTRIISHQNILWVDSYSRLKLFRLSQLCTPWGFKQWWLICHLGTI